MTTGLKNVKISVLKLSYVEILTWQMQAVPLSGHSKTIFKTAKTYLISLDTGQLSQQPRHPLAILIALTNMQQQVLTFTTRLKIYNFIDLEIFRAAAK